MANSGIDFNPGSHPFPDDRNRSILWARYKMEDAQSNESGSLWCVLSIKQTDKACSYAVIDSKGKTILDSVITPQSYAEQRKELVDYFRAKEVIVWDLKEKWGLLNQLDALFGVDPSQNLATVARTWTWHDIADEYARFVGELVPGCNLESGRTYSPEPFKPLAGLSCAQECKDIKDIIVKMAGTSLVTDPLASGKKGWTAEFYRPNFSPTEKLKKFFEF
ncbi:MAG: hypothetical protein KIT34_13835 [Cyanobacteria bacterium TGS_CYA1]|nr:hypothetical protein [Cyanobacteria bacterium TGS_CYA1]